MDATVHDVAKYILEKTGTVSAMKLQKLLYYCQAWSLVWDDRPMFPEAIEAWTNGPVVREVYDLHRGLFAVSAWPRGNTTNLDDDARETIDIVLDFYAKHNAQWLSDLTHAEDPWNDAREGLDPDVRGERKISLASMMEYYSSLPSNHAETQ
ncbi:MAG: DUF4065 domain-containing protein [Armatimonadota bacterium]|nr:DUF4065 domain-containing protein [Armatimonadota bacterium]